MSSRSFSSTGIILKRTDVGEADRVVTIFTKEHGKLTAIAKGCRKISSSRASALEPGSFSKLFFVRTQGMPILTQTQLIEDFSAAKQDLTSMRKVFEVLEMLDSLLIEQDEQSIVFDHALAIFTHMNGEQKTNSSLIRAHLTSIIEVLGFADRSEIDFSKPLRDFIETLTQRKLKAYAFLTQA